MTDVLDFQSNFSSLDWVIVAVYLAGTVIIGLYVNRYIRTMADYVVAGRSLKSLLAIATMIGSELGLVTVMYSAQKGFTGGFAAFHIGVLAGVATLVVGFTGFIVVPLRKMGVMTIPEYYERRFGSRGLRMLGGFLLALAGILNMGLFLKAGAVFVTALTGMTDPIAVKMVITVLIVLVLIYTVLGGMVSVVITDYIQFVVLSIGMLLIAGVAISKLGWTNIIETVQEVHGEAGFNPVHESGFGTSYVVWMFFLGLVSCAVWQTAVLRACAAESVEVVRKLYKWSSIGFMIRFMIPQFIGICALVYFWQDPIGQSYFFTADGQLIADHTLEAMPLFLSQVLPIGIIGIIGAGMLAGFMSTHDTYLLTWATSITEDVINPFQGYRLSTPSRIRTTRVLIVMIAAFLLIWSLWYELEQDLWDYMAVTGAIYFTGAFSVLLCGIYWKRASTIGAYMALSSGLLALFGLAPIQEAVGLPGLATRFGLDLTSAHIGLFVTFLSIVLMVLGSLAFPDPEKTDEAVTA